MFASQEGASSSGLSFPLQPTQIHVSDEQLSDLHTRLKRTRWPLDASNDDWYYGVGRAYLEELVDYWLNVYDWRKAETAINRYEHYRVNVDGVPVHFMRKPGIGPKPIPLILTHGWPWTFWHWSKVIDPLADPGAFGGDPADAFEVIVPSLPCFGFSHGMRNELVEELISELVSESWTGLDTERRIGSRDRGREPEKGRKRVDSDLL